MKLRTTCEDENHAIRELGQAVSEKLKRRLADLCACTTINDLVAGKPNKLDSSKNQDMAISLGEGFHMIFRANHTENPINESGKIDWARVNRVKIMSIEKYA